MSQINGKIEVSFVNAIPQKRIFWSIINDYDFKTAICELIDNAIDVWGKAKRGRPLQINIEIDADRQIIRIEDNASGVRSSELNFLVSPGSSSNDPNGATIGVFGVGNKRAVVALAGQSSIKTRYGAGKSYQIDVTDDWLELETWEIPTYEIPSIAQDTTIIELSHLRTPLRTDDADLLQIHLSATYGTFLESKQISIKLNDKPILPTKFENWAYPPEYQPESFEYIQEFTEYGLVHFSVTGGLILDRDPEASNYGIYVYCNDRLIAKDLKSRDVGYFNSGEAGVPHPDASLCRVIVRISGPARLMPWNSSKNALNPEAAAFKSLRPSLIRLVTQFTALSRRLKGVWQEKVLKHTAGTIQIRELDDLLNVRRLALPPLPRGRRNWRDDVLERNTDLVTEKPWTLGFIEAIAAADVIRKQRYDTSNRIALVLLDSNFEIALKEYIVHNPEQFPRESSSDDQLSKLFKDRRDVVSAIKEKLNIEPELVRRANHYYNLRNKLIHERATTTVTNNDIENYRNLIENLLGKLFGLRFDLDS